MTSRVVLGAACLAVAFAACSRSPRDVPSQHSSIAGTEAVPDPATGLRPPAAMDEVAIPSHGARLNGLVYRAAGAGAHPLVIFLHGFPGNEKNLDLAQAVRRAGYQALYVDYRGLWGSGGTFSFVNSLEDTKAVLSWAREPKNAANYGFDLNHIALVGHSFGGWLALMTAPSEPASVCVAGFAAWNVGGAALRYPIHPDERSTQLSDFRGSTDPTGGPVKANADDLLGEMSAHASEWDYRARARGLADRALLLVAATRDTPDEDVTMHEQLEQAVRAAGGHRIMLVQYDDDHPFSSHRVALSTLLVHWLQNECAQTQSFPQ
jgi:pimeloyl-ACP methyl ester carboxylesterase